MEWATHDHIPPPRPDPPAPVRLEICWRVLMAPSGRILTCGLYEHPRGVEVRCGYADDEPIHTRLKPSIGEARSLAATWLDAIKAKGSYEELPMES